MAQDIVHSYATQQDVATAVTDAFVAFVAQSIEETGSCIVAITGGTIPNLLFEKLNDPAYSNRVDWERTFFLWTDERFISQTDPDNHYYRAKKRLFSNLRGAHVFPINTDKGTLRNAAVAYEQQVRVVLQANGKEGMDLTILGLGNEGHTAGLFSNSMALRETDNYVAPVENGKIWNRVTMTFPLLSKSRHIWYAVSGESKRMALTKVLRQREDYQDLPWQKRIGRVLPGAVLSHEEIHWYVDCDAKGK